MNIKVIEQQQHWGISFNGDTVSPEKYFPCTDKIEAFRLKSLIDESIISELVQQVEYYMLHHEGEEA